MTANEKPKSSKKTSKTAAASKPKSAKTPTPGAPSPERIELARRVSTALKERYPEPSCALDYMTPFQLLVATILSAQCTDKRVNATTPALFERFPTARDFAEAPVEEIETLIQSCGFFHTKAANISKTSKILVARYGGEVPADLDALVALPGVGRKTANVVLGNAFKISSGFVVDTHVSRLSRKIGLSDAETPEKIERDLNELFPPEDWIDASHQLIYLGREFCVARRPKCEPCPLNGICRKRD